MGRKRDCGESVVRDSKRQLGEHIGSRRSDEKKIGAIGEIDVGGTPGFPLVEYTRGHRIFRQGLKSHRRDKTGRIFRHDNEDRVSTFDKFASEVSGFVGRDGTGDAKDDRFHEMRTSLRLW